MIESVLGVSVTGFRAPSYDVDRECLELLEECGYQYDSSVFPTAEFAARMHVSRISPAPHQPYPGRQLLEFPLPEHRPAPFPFHPSYSLVLGQWYFRSLLRRFRRKGHPLVLLLHLTDVADPLESSRLPSQLARVMTLSHLQSASKLARCQMMLDEVSRRYSITTTAHLLADLLQQGGSADSSERKMGSGELVAA